MTWVELTMERHLTCPSLPLFWSDKLLIFLVKTLDLLYVDRKKCLQCVFMLFLEFPILTS